MHPKISFITVVYNDPEGLRKTLQNIVQSKYPNKEIIVVDGLSTDSTPSVTQEFIEHITHYTSEPDSGIYDAMNKGIELSTGQYIWFVNAGDIIHNTEKLYEIFTTDHFLGDIYYGETMIVDAQGKELGLRGKRPPKELSVQSLLNGMVICHQSFLMRRSLAPKYDLGYRFSSDYKWMIDCVRVAKSKINTGVVLSSFSLGGATTKHHKSSLMERFRIMRGEFGLFRTVIMHLKFLVNAPFSKKYR